MKARCVFDDVADCAVSTGLDMEVVSFVSALVCVASAESDVQYFHISHSMVRGVETIRDTVCCDEARAAMSCQSFELRTSLRHNSGDGYSM